MRQLLVSVAWYVGQGARPDACQPHRYRCRYRYRWCSCVPPGYIARWLCVGALRVFASVFPFVFAWRPVLMGYASVFMWCAYAPGARGERAS